MSDTGWHWSDGSLVEEFPAGSVGFVYMITCKNSGKFYVGKKKLNFKRTKQVKGKKKRIEVESDWRIYYGSNDELRADVAAMGEDAFYRMILHVCKTLSECNYMETYEIFNRNCLLREDCYNSWVSCKIHKKHVVGKLRQL